MPPLSFPRYLFPPCRPASFAAYPVVASYFLYVIASVAKKSVSLFAPSPITFSHRPAPPHRILSIPTQAAQLHLRLSPRVCTPPPQGSSLRRGARAPLTNLPPLQPIYLMG